MIPLRLGVLALAASFTVAGLVLWQPQSFTSAINRTAEFNCSISNGSVQWAITLINTVALNWPLHSAALMSYGISAVNSATQQQSTLFMEATYQNNGTSVRCLSSLDPVTQSAPALLTVYSRPTPPTKLGAALAGNFSLNISWVPPFSLPGVSIWYSIFVDGNVTALVAGRSYYVYRYTGNSPCQKHNITAVAGNAAGDSDPSEPLLSDIPEVGQFVAAPNSMVVLNNVTLILNLKVATCPSFPLQGLYVQLANTIAGSRVTLGPYIPANNGSEVVIVINTSEGLQPNMKYVYTITAVNMVGNSTSAPQSLYTTDAQSSTITGSDHQLNVTCFFAEGTQARGCAVCLEKSGEVVCQMVPRVNETAKGVIRTEFSVDCYNISVVDWEEDWSIGSLGVPVNSSVENKILECGVTVNPDAFPELVYVITGVAIAGAIIVIAALIIAIGICSRKCRTKQAELTRNDVPSSTSVPSNGHQRTDHTTLNTFASDPVYSSSILYMGITRTSKLPNEKVAAVDTLSRQWEANLTPPTSSTGPYQHLATPTSSNRPPSVVDYSRLHRQNTGDRRFSIPSSSSNPPPHPLTISGTIPLPHHLPMGHPHQLAIGESPVYATPTQQRPSSVSGQGRSVGHEYETPLEQQGRWRGGVSEERLREDGAFTDV